MIKSLSLRFIVWTSMIATFASSDFSHAGSMTSTTQPTTAPAAGASVVDTAMALLAKGDQAGAHALLSKKLLDQLKAHHKPDPEQMFLLAILYRSRFEIDESTPLFKYVQETAPKTLHGKVAHSILMLDRMGGEIAPEYVELCEQVKQDPHDPLLPWLAGIECRSCKLNEEGVKFYAQVLTLWNPGPAMVHQTYANLLDDLGKSDEALPHRLLTIKLEPEPWAYDGLGNSFTALKRWKEADEAYTHSTEMDPGSSLYWKNWWCSMKQRGDETGAAKILEKQTAAENAPASTTRK